MEDILEFKAYVADVDFHFTDNAVNDFIYFIESKSIYWGGGYDKDYVQGSLYSKRENIIDKDILTVEVGNFFKRLNEKIEVEIK